MKDPAVLFYTADFITGTLTMTDEQRGKYIMLLCLQHQKGKLTEKDMLNICKTYDKDIWEKFIQDGDEFYNERMRIESDKRRKYSQSRSNNRRNKENDDDNICETYEKHMVNINEDINSNTIPDFSEFKKHALEKVPNIDIAHLKLKYDAWIENGWKDGNDKKITIWRSKLNHTLPHIKVIERRPSEKPIKFDK